MELRTAWKMVGFGLFLGAALIAPGGASAGELEGEWRVESVEREGRVDRAALDLKYRINDEPEKVIPFTYVYLKGRALSISWGQPGKDFTGSGDYPMSVRVWKRGTGRIDLATPRGLGRPSFLKSTYPGVYRLEGDRLTVCFAEPGKPRPMDPNAKTTAGETKVVLHRGGPLDSMTR